MSKRDNIVHAALKTFQENGIEKTKISDIVKEAGIAQGTFYLYFSSKLALMPAIAEVMVEKILTNVKDHVDDYEKCSVKMKQFVNAIFSGVRQYKEIHALIYSGLASTEYLNEWETVYEPIYEYTRTLLEDAQKAGEIRTSIQIDVTAKLIIGLVESAAEQIYLYDINGDEQARIQKNAVNDLLAHALGYA